MAKFRVTVIFVAYETATVEVEADDENSIDTCEVGELAYDKLRSSHQYPDYEIDDTVDFDIRQVK